MKSGIYRLLFTVLLFTLVSSAAQAQKEEIKFFNSKWVLVDQRTYYTVKGSSVGKNEASQPIKVYTERAEFTSLYVKRYEYTSTMSETDYSVTFLVNVEYKEDGGDIYDEVSLGLGDDNSNNRKGVTNKPDLTRDVGTETVTAKWSRPPTVFNLAPGQKYEFNYKSVGSVDYHANYPEALRFSYKADICPYEFDIFTLRDNESEDQAFDLAFEHAHRTMSSDYETGSFHSVIELPEDLDASIDDEPHNYSVLWLGLHIHFMDYHIYPIYLYRYNSGEPLDASVIRTAPDSPGEFGDTELPDGVDAEDFDPDDIIPPVIVILVGTGAVAYWRKRKKEAKRRKQEDDEEDDDEEKEENEKDEDDKREKKPASKYKMILYKDFGDTLYYGESPQLVGARIEEITQDGQHFDRPDLSARIQIFEKENIHITQTGRYKNYQSAMVEVQQGADLSSGSAALTFIYMANGGSLTMEARFKVCDRSAIIVKDEICFAAGLEAEQYMEFILQGSLVKSPSIEVSMLDGNNHFICGVSEGDREGLFRVDLKELGFTPDDENAIPGKPEFYTCEIKVQKPFTKQVEYVVEEFKVVRIHLGLQVQLTALKAYLVEPGSTYKKEILPTKRKPNLEVAQSQIDYTIFTVDENGQLISPIPDDDPEFIFEDVFIADSDKCLLVKDKDKINDKDNNEVLKPCETLGFKYHYISVEPQNMVRGVLCPENGYLMAPNRSLVKVTIKARWKGQTFTTQMLVPLISQPYRELKIEPGSDVVHASLDVMNQDHARRRELEEMLYKLKTDPNFVQLQPLWYKIYVMLEGYHENFGFYDPDFNGIVDIFRRYTRGEIGTVFVNKHVMNAEEEDEYAFYATLSSMESSIAVIGLRIGLGFVTGGASEVIIAPVFAMNTVRSYVNSGLDHVWGPLDSTGAAIAFCCVKVGLEEAFGRGVGKAASWIGGKISSTFKPLYEAGMAAIEKSKLTNKLTRSGGFSSKGVTDTAKKGLDAGKKLRSQAAAEGEQLCKKAVEKTAEKTAGKAAESGAKTAGKKAVSAAGRKVEEEAAKSGIDLASLARESHEYAQRDAQRIVDNFRRVMNNPTATKEECRRAALALQSSKGAQEILKQQPSDLLRANFNAQMQEVYKEVDSVWAKKMAKSHPGTTEDQFFIYSASGNSARDAARGYTVPADRDVSPMMRTKYGTVIELDEAIQTQSYAEAFFEVTYKDIIASQKEMIMNLQKFDQAVVNSVTGKESYGIDLGRIIDNLRQSEKLLDPKKVMSAFKDKSMVFFEQANAIKLNALPLYEQGFKEEACHLFGFAERLVKEGLRQNTKQVARIIDARANVVLSKGVEIPGLKKMYSQNAVIKNVVDGHIAIQDGREILAEHFNTTFEKAISDGADMIGVINDML